MTIKILVVTRTIFIATFLLTAFKCAPTKLWTSNFFIYINVGTFAFSNGYLATLCSMKAPGTVKEEERGLVGGFIGITITLGIFLGSLIAFGLAPLLRLTSN